MRRLLSGSFVLACVCAFAVSPVAQEKPQEKPQQKPQAQKEHTMTGCLQKGSTPDTFVVTNTAGKGPKLIGIVESKADLAPHVGHQINITGVAVPNKEAESMKPAPPKADHYMRLSAIKMVSATCP